MIKKNYPIFFLSFLLLVFCQCSNPDDFGPQTNFPQDTTQPISTQNIPMIFIANEGNFGWGANASLSVYFPNENRIVQNYFEKIAGYKLGDVAHSAHIKDSLLFIVVNNSNKIEILNIEKNSYYGKIENLLSPRQVLFVNNEIWVSDLYSGKIEILDKSSFAIVSSITTSDWNEQMILSKDGNHVFTVNVKAGELLKINTATKSIENRLKIAPESTDLIADTSGDLYTMNQKLMANQQASILKINPYDLSVIWEYEIEDKANPISLIYNQNNSTLCYVSEKSVIKLPIDAPHKDNSLMYNLDVVNAYNLAYNKNTNEYYLTDAKDYLQNGSIIRLTQDFAVIHRASVGVIPNDMVFWN